MGSNNNNLKAKKIFWNQYDKYVIKNNVNDDAGMVMDRFVASSFYAAKDMASKNDNINYPTKLNGIDSSSILIRRLIQAMDYS